MKKPKKTNHEGKSWYQIHNKTNGQNETRIDIMEDIGFFGVTAKEFKSDLDMLGEKEPLHIHINSDGGDMFEGNEIYNLLLAHQGNVRVTIGALAASMASVIAMAGDEISIADNGFFMIHNPWTIAMGDADELERSADVLKKLKDGIVKAYMRHCDCSEKELRSMMDEETWMTADEALENGFVGAIDNKAEEEDTAANFDLSRFLNSANFLSRLKMEHLAARGTGSGRGNRNVVSGKVTLLDLQEAVEEKPETTNKPVVVNQRMKPETQDPPGTAAPVKSQEQVDKEIKDKADALYANKLKRDKEIDDIVKTVRDRDKKDFAELATEFKLADKSPDDFARAIVTSDKFKQFEVVGSGIQMFEPLDELKGSPGFMVVTNEQYKAVAEMVRSRGRGSIPQKTQILINTPYRSNQAQRFMDAPGPPTSTGLTSIEKQPGVITLGVRPLMVKDLLAPGATSGTTIRYIREVSFTNYATTVAEGAAKPAALFEYQEVDAPVRKIAAFVKVTDELFSDYLQMASYINERLPYMVQRTEEDQLLNGNGTPPNLTGILQTAGIQTQAKGADTAADALFKALTNIRFTGFFEPDGYVIHPTDWQNLRLAKDSAGQYFGGGPFTGAYGNSPLVMFDSYWGKPVAITPAIAQGTALAGSFRLGAQYFQREGLTIDMTNSDQDDFIKNLMTIRAEERLALAVYRPLAFCQITGL